MVLRRRLVIRLKIGRLPFIIAVLRRTASNVTLRLWSLFLIFFLGRDWSINLINRDVLVRQSNPTGLCVDLQMVAITQIRHELRKLPVLHEAGWIIPSWHLLLLLLLENVQEGAMRRLNRNHQTLIF